MPSLPRLPEDHPDLRRARRALEVIDPQRRTEVVDIGASLLEDLPPYLGLLQAGGCRVTGFEPRPDAHAELVAQAGDDERYLNAAVGDGRAHTLYECASPGFSSLLAPDPEQLAMLTDFPRLATVEATSELTTRRLDELAEIGQLDLLKIDIQGAELSVFQHGRRTLAGAVAVHTEAGFTRLYRDQPTFAEVDQELRAHGFAPHQFISVRTWPLAPVQWADPIEVASRQLVEADVLYVRDPAQLGQCSEDQLEQLAVIAGGIYASAGLAYRCLLELDARRGTARAERYHAAVAADLPSYQRPQ